jgi:hypothetical protein
MHVMKAPPFLSSLLAGAIGLGVVVANDPSPSQADDAGKANQVLEVSAEHLLTDLAHRLQTMLDQQIVIHERTVALYKVLQKRPDMKPRPRDRKAVRDLVASQKATVIQATRILELLEEERTAFVFTEFFRELRKDMERLQGCLKSYDLGTDTQTLEQDLIEVFQDLISGTKSR